MSPYLITKLFVTKQGLFLCDLVGRAVVFVAGGGRLTNILPCLIFYLKKQTYFLLYFESEVWWLVNKKGTNNCYSPSLLCLKPKRFYSSGGVAGRAGGPYAGDTWF